MRGCTRNLPSSRVVKDARVKPDKKRVSGSGDDGIAAGKDMYKRFYGKGKNRRYVGDD